MSLDIEFAFNAPGDLIEVGRMVSAALGVNLQPYEGNAEDLFARFLRLELSLCTCDICNLEDDGEVDWSRYRFILDTRTAWGASDLRAYQIEATALAAYALLVRGTPREGILVYNTGLLMARYTVSPAGEVYDSVSDAAVVFPRHFEEIRARIDGAC